MYLFLDTSRFEGIRLAIFSEQTHQVSAVAATREAVLPAVEDFLRLARLTPADLKGVAVVTGPGGFSALRTGIAIANALGATLSLPVLAVVAGQSTRPHFFTQAVQKIKKLKKFRPVTPQYGSEPNIHFQKKKT